MDDELHDLAVGLLVRSARLTRLAVRRTGAELPTAQWRALSQLDELGPLRVTELATIDRSSQPAATAMVRRLVDRGLAERSADPGDSRAVLVSLSTAGAQALLRQRDAAAEAIGSDLAELSDDERRCLAEAVEVLGRLLARASPD